MALQSSCSNDIKVVEGNELKLFIDTCTNLISVKDSNGCVQSLDNFIIDEGITRVIAGECLSGGGTTATVTLNHACTSTLSGTYGQPLLQDGCYIKSITVDEFGHYSGLKLNIEKNEGLWLGANKDNKSTPLGISWPKSIRILGIYFSYHTLENNRKNFEERIEKCPALLTCGKLETSPY